MGIEVERVDRAVLRIEEDIEARGYSVGGPCRGGFGEQLVERGAEAGSGRVGAAVGVRFGDHAERCGACGRGNRVGVEGAGVLDFLLASACHGGEVEPVEDIGAAGDGPAGQAAGEDLGKAREVRLHAEGGGRAAGGDAESGDHLVEDEERAVPFGEKAERVEELGAERHLAEGGAGGLDDRGGDVRVRGEGGGELRFIARFEQPHLGRDPAEHAHRGRAVEMARVAGGHMVVPAVEMAFEAEQRIAAGEGAREPHRHQRGLGAGRREAQAFGERDQAAHRGGPADLARVVGAEMRACGECGLDGAAHRLVPVAEQQRPVPAEIVDIFVPIDVPFARALGVRDVDAVGIDVARVVGDAAREQRGGLARKLRRAGRAGTVGGDDARIGSHGFERAVHLVRSCA